METSPAATPELKPHTLRSTKRVLFTSFFVDGFSFVLATVAAIVTGSVVMMTAATQSIAELVAAGLFIYGKKYAAKRPTKLHPFGFGKEVYYWVTLGAFVVIAAAGVLAFKYGYQELLHPTSLKYEMFALAALFIALSANVYSFHVSSGKLLGEMSLRDLPKVFMSSPLLAAKSTVVLDVMGSLASVMGITLLSLSIIAENSRLDGVGAILMGMVYLLSSVGLLFGVRGLVTGQSATPEVERRIRDAAREVPEVKHVLGMRTMLLGSDKLLVNIEVHLKDGLTTDQVEETIERVKESIEATSESHGLNIHVEPDAYHDVHR